MNTRELKRMEARRRLNEGSGIWEEVPSSKWPDYSGRNGVTRVFQNSWGVALVYDNAVDPEGNPAIMIRVRNNFGKPVGWKELQDCKNGIFGPEIRAIQYLPKESELVDQANMYWFYVRKEKS